jgi:prepilin-type N-terminal cleavage/methylation domain-containing protein
MNRNKTAFTLIELLIVVAIIAILAAIAVPNFLEAQVRSKVSRTKADMRSIATALESYSIDNNNHYPPAADVGQNASPTSTGFHTRLPTYLTTPIAYITSILHDPFVSQDNTFVTSTVYPPSTEVGKRYAYYCLSSWTIGNSTQPYHIHAAGGDVWNGIVNWVGLWLVYSYGPDKVAFHGAGATLLPYDATNGTISTGNIVRCQKTSDGTPVHPVTGTYNW